MRGKQAQAHALGSTVLLGVPLHYFIGLQTASKFMVGKRKVTVIFEVGKVGLGLQAEHLRWVTSPCWHL